MQRFKSGCRWLVVLVVCCFVASACGDEVDDEVVYLHLFNGYPGGSSIDIIGPTGVLKSDIRFGERTEEPVAVNRDLGTDLTVLIDGASETFDISLSLFDLYPHETATLIVSRRDDNDLMYDMLRHQQSIASACRIVFINSLSVGNDELANYNAILGWEFGDALVEAGFDESLEESALDEEDQRPEMYDAIANHPYFALASLGEGEGIPQWTWLGPEGRIELPYVQFESGTVLAPRNSEDYIQCIQEQEEEGSDDDNGDDDNPLDELLGGGDDVDCTEDISYDVQAHTPGQFSGFVQYFPSSIGNSGDQCDASHRIFTDFGNVFTPPEGETIGHDHEDSEYFDFETVYDRPDHSFAVLYGRPVDPVLETWAASDHFEEPPPYPEDPEAD